MESLEASLAPAVACIRYEKSYTVTGDVYVCVVVPRNGLSASGMSERVLYTVVWARIRVDVTFKKSVSRPTKIRSIQINSL